MRRGVPVGLAPALVEIEPLVLFVTALGLVETPTEVVRDGVRMLIGKCPQPHSGSRPSVHVWRLPCQTGHAGREVAADAASLERGDYTDNDNADVTVALPTDLGEPNRLFVDPGIHVRISGGLSSSVHRSGDHSLRPLCSQISLYNRQIVGAADADTSSRTSSGTSGAERNCFGSVISR